MDISCNKCQAKFRIADEKIPKGKTFAVSCPKCKEKITIGAKPAAAAGAPKGGAAGGNLADEVASGAYDSSERPFDFIEKGAKTALICEPDPAYRNQIREAVAAQDYHIAEPKNARDALKQMRFHLFDLIVINEAFDTTDPDHNNLLRYLERLEMSTRRNMFVALVTERFRTGDNMAAFHKSVNTIVNTQNLENFDKILKQSVVDFENFYRVYKESMVKTGRV
jgi:predicted Zn finger-like uncharacterized protein